MAKKLKVWLNNKLNKRLRCTVVIKFYPIFITELVLTFLVFKYPNYFEFPKCGKWSPHLKILEIPGGRGGHQRPPGMENPGGWGGGANQRVFRGGGEGYFLEPHIPGLFYNGLPLMLSHHKTKQHQCFFDEKVFHLVKNSVRWTGQMLNSHLLC